MVMCEPPGDFAGKANHEVVFFFKFYESIKKCFEINNLSKYLTNRACRKHIDRNHFAFH